jgi:hypothetical protein
LETRWRDHVGRRLAGDELHHDGGRARRFLYAVHRRDVRMIQRREQFRFALEPRDSIGIRRKHLGQYLDRNLAPQLRVARAIDLAP